MNLSSSELTSLRLRPHRTRLWLSVYQPETVFGTQINQASISKGARQITVTSLSGSAGLVDRGMTCLIGSTQGGAEIGRIRVISATPTQITVAENSYSWNSNWYLTVVRYYEPWAVFPRTVLDSDNNPTYYKDYDIAYTDQNQIMDPVVGMGSNYAGFLETLPSGTYCAVWYTSSGTFDPTPGGSMSSYDWWFQGGSPTGSTDADPGYVDYTGAGHFITRLRAVNSNNKTGTSYRHVSIYERPTQTSENKPIMAWGFDSLDGDRESGGYTLSAWIRETADLSTIKDGALIVVFSDDYEGGAEVTKVGANAENRGSILFVGYINEETIYYDAVTSRYEFEVVSLTGRMEMLATFSGYLECEENAMTWYQLRDMTVDRALVHFLRWHSTVLHIADLAPTNDDRFVKHCDIDRGTLYEACNNWLENTILARMVSDRQGKLWCEIEANAQPTGSSRMVNDTMENVITLARQDWRNEISITRRADAELAYVELGGVHYSGPSTTGSFEALLSGAPGEAPDYFGDTERASGLVLGGQDQLNKLTGLVWAWRNAIYPEVDVPIAGDYRFLDIAPQHRILMNVESSDTYRGITWTDKPFIPQGVNYEYQAENQVLLMELNLAEETGQEEGFGYGDGQTIEIPADPPYDPIDLPEWEDTFPPIIPPDPWTPGDAIGPPEGTGNEVYILFNNRLVRSRNFWSDSPNYEVITMVGVTGSYSSLWLDPSDPINSAYLVAYENYGSGLIGEENNGNHIYKTNNLQSSTIYWTEIFGATEIANELAGSNYQRQGGILLVPESCPGYIGMMWSHKAVGSTETFVYSTDYGATWSHKDLGAGNRHDHPGWIDNYNTDASDLVIYSWNGIGVGGNRLHKSVTGGQTWVVRRDDHASCSYENNHVIIPDGTGERVLWVDECGGTVRLRYSGDSAATETDVSASFGGANYAPDRTYSNTSGPTSHYTMHAHPSDANWYGIMCKNGDDDQQNIFFARVGGIGGSWDPRHAFVGKIYPLWWFHHNPLYWYAWGNTDDNYIIGSANGGYTWLNKEGDFESVVGSSFASVGRPVAIRINKAV